MAYKNLAGYVKHIPYVGERLSHLVDSLDSALVETDWFLRYSRFIDNHKASTRRASYVSPNLIGGRTPSERISDTIHDYQGRGFGSFLYNLTIRGPLVILGNLVAAPLNMIAAFIDVILGYETDHHGDKYCDWYNNPMNSITNMIRVGFGLNFASNFGECLIGLLGGLIIPIKALSKVAVNVGVFLLPSKNSQLNHDEKSDFTSTYTGFNNAGLMHLAKKKSDAVNDEKKVPLRQQSNLSALATNPSNDDLQMVDLASISYVEPEDQARVLKM